MRLSLAVKANFVARVFNECGCFYEELSEDKRYLALYCVAEGLLRCEVQYSPLFSPPPLTGASPALIGDVDPEEGSVCFTVTRQGLEFVSRWYVEQGKEVEHD